MQATTKHDLFFVRRNTNRNEVHYAIHLSPDSGLPDGPRPLTGYWKMFEKGPDVTEPILLVEQMAFGIRSQRREGDNFVMVLNALPEREIRIEPEPGETGRYTARMVIAGKIARLTDFYVQADAGFLMPKVRYLDINGEADGQPVTERINKG